MEISSWAIYVVLIKVLKPLCATVFHPSARWARRGIVVPFVRRRRTHSFGYYTNMVQQIKFIIHTNIQPLPALFLPKVKVIGQGQR